MREEFLPFITFILNLIRNTNGFYTLYSKNVNFLEAVRICNSINATVVFINNSSEDLFIKDNYLNSPSVKQGIWLLNSWYSGVLNSVPFCVW
jgi:response regulator of citrate/malate metabolism